jgi:hypothetical protein
MDATAYAGPIAVTLAYIGVYYGFQIHVARTKTRLAAQYKADGERFDRYFGQDRHMLAADRIQLNTLEHMGPFLALLWLNAVFVGTGAATVAGGIYVAARMVYPLLIGMRLGRGIKAKVLAATVPGYLVLTYFCVQLARAAFA